MMFAFSVLFQPIASGLWTVLETLLLGILLLYASVSIAENVSVVTD